MANLTLAMDTYGLPEVQRNMKSELRRLGKHRLKEDADDPDKTIDHLTSAGVLTRRFAALIRRILNTAPETQARKTSLVLASDALEVLKIVPNRRG